jgi:hypothetical protein
LEKGVANDLLNSLCTSEVHKLHIKKMNERLIEYKNIRRTSEVCRFTMPGIFFQAPVFLFGENHLADLPVLPQIDHASTPAGKVPHLLSEDDVVLYPCT